MLFFKKAWIVGATDQRCYVDWIILTKVKQFISYKKFQINSLIDAQTSGSIHRPIASAGATFHIQQEKISHAKRLCPELTEATAGH